MSKEIEEMEVEIEEGCPIGSLKEVDAWRSLERGWTEVNG